MLEKRNKLKKILEKTNSLAIIGLAKNVGKTTTLKAVLELLDNKSVILSSIGYDGETQDLVFNTQKPRIFVKKGMYVATAKKCILNSNVDFEIMETTNFKTPLGVVVVAQCLSDGYLELAGPSTNSDLLKLQAILAGLVSGILIVDGAIDRKSFSNPDICEKTILCSGMVLANNIDEVVSLTKYQIELYDLKVFKLDVASVKLAGLLENNNISELKLTTLYNQEQAIIESLSKNTQALIIRGPLMDKLVLQILKYHSKYNELIIVVDHANMIFIKQSTFELIKDSNVSIQVQKNVDIIAISMNPQSLTKLYDSDMLVQKMEDNCDKLVIDVKGGM